MTQPVALGRNTYFDSLKFVLITLVVLGHVLESNLTSRLGLATYNTIYLFHMPLFVFVSGYFCKRDVNAKKKTKTLLFIAETLLVFQTLHSIIGLVKGVESWINILFSPSWTMWYLYSLIAWRTIVYITPPDS